MYGRHIAPLLTTHGISTVINLRGENPNSSWYLPERRACEALGITYLDRPLHSRRLPKQQMLIELFEAYETAPRPLLIKCSGGADRTALAAALYLLHRDGPSAMPLARRQMALLPYLHQPKRYQRWIRSFPVYFEADHDGSPIADWVRDRYRPEHFAAWLDERGMDGTWRR
ncbi:MAG: hypothetical protein P8N43_06165 [Alphaproteobacteria bacterium]|jgi:hypothetical protein|nr:hypothetical protein [Alphaproteobacteria bacterium]